MREGETAKRNLNPSLGAGCESESLDGARPDCATTRAERDKQLQAILDLSPTFISYVGRDRRYRIVSRHYLTYFGRSPDQIIGKEIREVIGEEAWRQVAPAVQRAYDGEVSHFQVKFTVPGLGLRWSQGTYSPDIASNGEVQGIVISVEDVTEQKQYERMLQDKDAFYRSIFESQGVANFETEAVSGRLLRVNSVACEMLGYSEKELCDGRTFLDITHPEDRERNRLLTLPLLRGEVEHFRFEKRYLRKDGTTVWANVAVTTLKDAEGRTARLLAGAQDITARVQAERALRESEERVRLAVSAAGIGYWTLDPKTGGGTLDAICAKHFGLGPTPTGDEVLAKIVPEDREQVRQSLYDSFGGERPYRAEFRIANSDGSHRWLMGLGGALKDSSGRVTGLSGVNVDISSRRLAEEEREKFVSLAANSSEFIAMCDNKGAIFFLNDAGLSMSGFHSLAEAQAVRIWDLFRLEERGFLKRELFERSFISGREEIETRVQNIKTGQARWVMLAVFPVRDSQGHPVALAAMGRDITERKNAEGMLTDAARRKDEFLATLAHELRNPLAPISNALQVWPRLERDPEQLSKIRSMMERQVQQLKHLIDDLLDVSRISQGKIQLRREELNLSSVLESAIESVRPSIDEAGHTLHFTLPGAPIFLGADRGRLIQILGNLIHNAAKYTQKNGQIWVSARAAGLWVEICIKDSGVGIAPEMLASIFEPFTQIHASRGLAQGGIGIGLSLVKNLVALHGGTIEAHSEGLDKGSEFVVRLPLLHAQDNLPASAPSQAQAAEGARGAIERQRVLIVDDERASADTLAMMLETLGQDVVVAYDALEALRLVGSISPDFVFSDIAMPGMDGLQLAREVSKRPGAKATLVAVTGYGQEQDRRRILEAGFKFHLVKPTTIQAVREVLGCNQSPAEPPP